MATLSRKVRVEAELKRIIANTLITAINNPLLQLITINDVRLSSDLAYATIFFGQLSKQSIVDTTKLSQIEISLNKCRGVFRSTLAKQLQLRVVPQIKFIYDSLPAQSKEINDLINKAMQTTSIEQQNP